MNVNRRIDSLGRIVLPIDYRVSLGLKEGDIVNISILKNRIIIAPNQLTCKLCGSTNDIDEIGLCTDCMQAAAKKVFSA